MSAIHDISSQTQALLRSAVWNNPWVYEVSIYPITKIKVMKIGSSNAWLPSGRRGLIRAVGGEVTVARNCDHRQSRRLSGVAA